MEAASVPVTSAADSRRATLPLLPAVGFGLALLSLLTAALLSLRDPGPSPTGLPDDPGAGAARSQVGRIAVATGELRLLSTLFGDQPGLEPAALGEGGDAAIRRAARLRAAEALLESARERNPRDPRLLAALGSLDLAHLRLERAESRYRAAVDRAGHYGEARLGLGVTLALRADLEGHRPKARRLRLAAIAQLAAVRASDPAYLHALYDRAWLLARVGRMDEARRLAAQYRERDSASRWAERLDREVGGGPSL